MKTLIALSLIMVYMAKANSSAIQDVKSKSTPNTLNIIPPVQKPEIFSSPLKYYPSPNYIPMQIIPKPVYMPQPHAMIIIAQPAYVPQSMLYGNNAIQQLLHYFHNNPQAKYHLLHGNYPPQPIVSPSLNNYILTPAHYSMIGQYQQTPQQYQPPQTTPYQPAQQYQTIQPQISDSYMNIPIRSTPAIVTGLENFTPEQQAQIKAHLGQHLGSNFQTLTGKNLGQFSKYSKPVQKEETTDQEEDQNQYTKG